MLRIDGARGEGGGQILRSALALSLVTQTPFRIDAIRAGRKRPGLLRQHLTAVRAASEVGAARVSGAELGSQSLCFEPTSIRSGHYRLRVGSAGSACLVLQTVLPALWFAAEASTVEVEGGTHAPLAPPYEFIESAYAPLIRRMGVGLELTLDKPGFMPAGGGRVIARVDPPRSLKPLELLERGRVVGRKASAWVAHVPRDIADRELAVVQSELGWNSAELETVDGRSASSGGNALLLRVESEHVTEVFSEIGTRGVRAERVARRALGKLRAYLDSDAPVGPYLADQLLLPLALAGSGAFRSTRLTEHSRTNMHVIECFLQVSFRVSEESPAQAKTEVVRVEVSS